MGQFAKAAAQYDTERRGDGTCVAGRWITDNLDEEDLVEFVRLAKAHKWNRIVRLSDHNLKQMSLGRHVHGTCVCFSNAVARGCCPCDQSGADS